MARSTFSCAFCGRRSRSVSSAGTCLSRAARVTCSTASPLPSGSAVRSELTAALKRWTAASYSADAAGAFSGRAALCSISSSRRSVCAASTRIFASPAAASARSTSSAARFSPYAGSPGRLPAAA
ncbi:MAG: hypothetical protein FJ028_10195 [Chloroflexi bacterium]|nr:hypothetical protein [Chloroflexota bacterium]